jgi:3-dehydroquinate dehydratase I
MPKTISANSLITLQGPHTVGIVSTVQALQQLLSQPAEQRLALCDLYELRLDLLPLGSEDLLPLLPELQKPVLLTLRHPAEGGQGPVDPQSRMEQLLPFLPAIQFLDVEVQFAQEMLPLIRQAQSLGKQVVGSAHDFSATPPLDHLRSVIAKAKELRLDMAKFATTLQQPADMQRLMQLLSEPAPLPLSVMGMGN